MLAEMTAEKKRDVSERACATVFGTRVIDLELKIYGFSRAKRKDGSVRERDKERLALLKGSTQN